MQIKISIFTFHNVSINTVFAYPFLQSIRTLHSTMFLLIQIADNVFPFSVVSLHSTMFLLIRAFRWWLRPLSCFTFHNVSINTYLSVKSLMCAPFFTFHNVSINTQTETEIESKVSAFTFHNVSINTICL